ncbi:RagB/SusD family nutrient uptake outer membrane protein [Flavobacteriaceae bacterium SZ-1-7]|uniref:RagB/SusD family nutrient uptake outer membrane protein n=1 Tax=Tamlana sedimenti TaxID=3134126 RepID=UPI003121867F
MKNIKLNKLIILLTIVFLSGCSTDFIEEKKNYQKVDVEIYQYESLATRYVDYIYNQMLPSGTVTMAAWSKAAADNSDVPGRGNPTIFAKATDEVIGEVDINKEWAEISPLNNHCLKSLGVPLRNPSNNAYTRIRYCNLYINNVAIYSKLDKDFENQVLGQLYFWRAWQYFDLVRLYGGIPIVLEEQPLTANDPINQTPRSSAEEVINQIVSDLEMSQSLLENARPYTAEEAGRITAAAAAALKGRVLLTWASPLFNRNDDQTRWQRAYDANLEAYNVCLTAGKGLDPDWKNMWFADNGMESIFAFGFNNYAANSGEIQKNNYTEYQTRSVPQGGNAGLVPTKNVMDAFPMADGTPYNPNGNLNHFYRNRDPRFYYTFAYNGSIWPYKESSNYKNWTYYWFPLAPNPQGPKIATNTPFHITGIYLRKFTNDASSQTNSYRNNGDDYMEIRFAEVVLNLAESAVGINNLADAKGYIGEVRERAGIQNLDGQYGLSSLSTRDQLFAAVINERKVEFAYENKRFFDLRRWMLYNDDFGTCTQLNQTPIEGSRRQGYYTFAKSDASNYYVGIPDPFKGANAPVINRDATSYPNGITSYSEYVDYLYDNHFEVVVRDEGIEVPTDFTFKWYNEYYFFGIYQNLLDTAPYLQQTQGWGGSFVPYN